MHAIEILTLSLIPAFLLLDLVHRAKPYATDRAWRTRALIVGGLNFGLSLVFAAMWASVFGETHLFDLAHVHPVLGAVLGVLVYELGHYAYHRAAHRFDWLWRWGHQMHHSAESLDTFGAYYMSPLDNFFFTTIVSFVFFPLLGLPLMSGLLGAAFLTFNALFQHANIRTPQWLGYIIQRPESHAVHHGRGVHAHNYCDLPLWDIVFGTFCNPTEFRDEVGFEPGASARLWDMARGVDVSLSEADAPGCSMTSMASQLSSRTWTDLELVAADSQRTGLEERCG